MSTIAKVVLSIVVIFGSALTSIGTAGLSGVAGIAILLAIWLPDVLDDASEVL